MPTINIGRNITSSADPLQKVDLVKVFHAIQNPRVEVASKIRQLRIIYATDRSAYNRIKKELPYLVCGAFTPAVRRKENFAYTDCFIVDIDHVTAHGHDLQSLRAQLQADPRVALSLLSPSCDGFKLLFLLDGRCYDAGQYAVFYKAFVYQFAQQYQLEQVVDARTSDVSRACFVSSDPEAYYNPFPEAVRLEDVIPADNTSELLLFKKNLEKEMAEVQQQQTEHPQPTGPSDNDIVRIKELLNMRKTVKERAEVFVPQQLDAIIDGLKQSIEETGVVVYEIRNISYGKKLKMKLGIKEAEVNLFYGKRGFSVVESPRCGTNPELNHLCAELVSSYVDSL